MKPSVWLGYILGRGDAIQSVAENRAAIGTGAVLVLLTSIARNYDQTFVLEKPFHLLFGSLLFSLVSGTWLYFVVYGWFVRHAAEDADGNKPRFWSGWRTFMGLFWMTAPAAWLYAIPVERFFDSLTAAKANLTLLAIVSLWRVLLMSRVIQFLTGARYYAVLLWVLFAAAVEILVVFFFGGAFGRALMASMGGMRNSPEETLLVNALGTVFVSAFWGAPILLVVAWMVGKSQSADDLPVQTYSQWPGRWLTVAAVIWVSVAIFPQVELSRTAKVERLLVEQKYREALDYLSVHKPDQFAPARTLAPNAFEREIFVQLPACFEVIQTNDAPWVKAHLLRRLDQMLSHNRPPWWRGPKAKGLTQLLDGLGQIPEGQAWLAANPTSLERVREALQQGRVKTDPTQTEEQQQMDLLTLSNRLSMMTTQRVETVVSP